MHQVMIGPAEQRERRVTVCTSYISIQRVLSSLVGQLTYRVKETPTKQNLETQPKDFKKEGKICTLRTEEDDDEDNNTWNGNSTQQILTKKLEERQEQRNKEQKEIQLTDELTQISLQLQPGEIYEALCVQTPTGRQLDMSAIFWEPIRDGHLHTHMHFQGIEDTAATDAQDSLETRSPESTATDPSSVPAVPVGLEMINDEPGEAPSATKGEDEQSKQLMSSWEDGSVSEAAQNCCVAIRVDAKRLVMKYICEPVIDPVVCIPSSFFIGVTGIPLEVIAGSVSPDELMKRINKVKKVVLEVLLILHIINAFQKNEQSYKHEVEEHRKTKD
ncbi:hypothetical protein CCH79_00019969 [Gambusia affinis]|uniref:Uncharacterized protein n=1 Tax=Gambusia affinis TaxID=33528 RepID=A0A315VAV8_GAMAF|nr:hypothetical protein CCH79_00019969 [Gambusia affinis]